MEEKFKKVVEVLESADPSIQATGYLRMDKGDKSCYCVLGLLCKVYHDETGKGVWIPRPKVEGDHRIFYMFQLNGLKNDIVAQKEVMQYFNLPAGSYAILWRLNDGHFDDRMKLKGKELSRKARTYKEIADLIKRGILE